MNEWEKVNETSFPEKEGFDNNLDMENITALHYMYPKRVCKDI